jgi:hypothetical protein
VRLLLIGVLLALCTLVVYWPVLRHEFVSYDDTDYVTANPYVQAGLSAKGSPGYGTAKSPGTGTRSRCSRTCSIASSTGCARWGIT